MPLIKMKPIQLKSKPRVLPYPSLPSLRWQRTLHFFLGLGVVTCVPALAAEGDVFRPYVGYSFSYDENVSGISDADKQTQNLSDSDLSDTSRRADAGLAINKRISQQVLSAKLNLAHITSDRLGTLNNKDLLGNWNWHVGDHVEGNLGASYVQVLSPYVNFDAPDTDNDEPNLRTQRREFFDASWLLHPSWRLRGGLSRDKLSYDVNSAGDRNEVTSELGLDYLAASKSTFGVQLRHTRGDLPNSPILANSYDQNEIKGKVNWLLTGKTQLQFLGGYVQRKHDSDATRDFNGPNARLIAQWKPTGKVGVTLSGWREIGALDQDEIGSPENLTASYALNQGISVGSTWDLTSKVRLDGQLKRETSDYRGAESGGNDTFRTASLKLVYRPTDHLQLAALAHRRIRDSSDGDRTPNTGLMLSSRYEF